MESKTLIGFNLYMNARGVLFEKVAGQINPIQDKYTAAEERFVRRQLQKGVKTHANPSQ